MFGLLSDQHAPRTAATRMRQRPHSVFGNRQVASDRKHHQHPCRSIEQRLSCSNGLQVATVVFEPLFPVPPMPRAPGTKQVPAGGRETTKGHAPRKQGGTQGRRVVAPMETHLSPVSKILKRLSNASPSLAISFHPHQSTPGDCAVRPRSGFNLFHLTMFTPLRPLSSSREQLCNRSCSNKHTHTPRTAAAL